MISFLFVLLALTSTSAHATPKVGDYAAYDMIFAKGGSRYQIDFSQELLQFNPANNHYFRQETFTLPGLAPDVRQTWLPASDFLSDENISLILNNCSSSGGNLQNITVPAGSFQTCAMPHHSEESAGTIWIANVPFGFVRLEATYENGVLQTILLQSFR